MIICPEHISPGLVVLQIYLPGKQFCFSQNGAITCNLAIQVLSKVKQITSSNYPKCNTTNKYYSRTQGTTIVTSELKLLKNKDLMCIHSRGSKQSPFGTIVQKEITQSRQCTFVPTFKPIYWGGANKDLDRTLDVLHQFIQKIRLL